MSELIMPTDGAEPLFTLLALARPSEADGARDVARDHRGQLEIVLGEVGGAARLVEQLQRTDAPLPAQRYAQHAARVVADVVLELA
jgi:hypothetical protein